MTDLIEWLYQYAQEERWYKYLDSQEYESNLHYSEQRLQWLMEHLDEPARKQLEDYRAMSAQAQAEADAALFRAALSLGLELSRA